MLQVLLVTLLAHWFCCVWGLQASFSASKLDTWLATHGLCWPISDEGHAMAVAAPTAGGGSGGGNGSSGASSWPAAVAGGEERLYACAGPWQQYLQSFYFALGIVLGYTSAPERGPSAPHHSEGANLLNWRPGEQLVLLVLRRGQQATRRQRWRQGRAPAL